MKYFFEAGGSDERSGGRPRDEDAGGEINGIRMSR